jgi:hypothetical protein
VLQTRTAYSASWVGAPCRAVTVAPRYRVSGTSCTQTNSEQVSKKSGRVNWAPHQQTPTTQHRTRVSHKRSGQAPVKMRPCRAASTADHMQGPSVCAARHVSLGLWEWKEGHGAGRCALHSPLPCHVNDPHANQGLLQTLLGEEEKCDTNKWSSRPTHHQQPTGLPRPETRRVCVPLSLPWFSNATHQPYTKALGGCAINPAPRKRLNRYGNTPVCAASGECYGPCNASSCLAAAKHSSIADRDSQEPV